MGPLNDDEGLFFVYSRGQRGPAGSTALDGDQNNFCQVNKFLGGTQFVKHSFDHSAGFFFFYWKFFFLPEVELETVTPTSSSHLNWSNSKGFR